MYEDFWSGYWKKGVHRDKYVERYIGSIEEGGPPASKVGIMTVVKGTAEFQAKLIGGYVVRRDKRGRFSKRGTRFQAVKRGRRKK
jgi:hypothetical protein